MKLIFSEGEKIYNQSVDAFFALHDNRQIYTEGLADLFDGVLEGEIKHVKNGMVTCTNLQTCSGVFYIYNTDDIIAFHSPGGGLKFKNSERKGNFGTPGEEAGRYEIGEYDSVRVVIAAGYNTFRYPTRGRTHHEIVGHYLAEAYGKLLELVRREVTEENIAIYVGARQGVFGINSRGYIGESGHPPRAVVSVPETVSMKKCCKCFISTAVCGALGKPDDCEELKTLRWYRDHVLIGLPGGPQAIRVYECIAPDVVVAIEGRTDAKLRYAHIYQTLVAPALVAIRSGQYQDAFRLYRERTLELAQSFGLNLDVRAGKHHRS